MEVVKEENENTDPVEPDENEQDENKMFQGLYYQLCTCIEEANTSSLKSLDLAHKLFTTKEEKGEVNDCFSEVSVPLMGALKYLGVSLAALQYIGKTYYGIIDDSEVKIDDVKKELPEDMTDIVEMEPMEEFTQIPSVADGLIVDNDDKSSIDDFNDADYEAPMDNNEDSDQADYKEEGEESLKDVTNGKPEEYTCDICNYSTTIARYLKQHKTTHTAGKYKCTECTFTCHKPNIMKSHMNKVHDILKVDFICERENPDVKHYMCQSKKCHYLNTKKSALESHFKLKHAKNGERNNSNAQDDDREAKVKEEEDIDDPPDEGHEYKCSKCDYVTKKKLYYTDHLDGSFRFRKCLWCDAHINLARAKMFARHLRIKHGMRKMSTSWKCKECGLELEKLELLESHMGKVHKIGPAFHCNQCNYSSYSRSLFKAHTENHESASLPCPECTHIAKSKFRLTKHVYSKHRTAECDECKATFKNKNALFKHNKTAHGMDPEAAKCCCDICGLFVSTPGALAQHKQGKHSNVKIQCEHEECDYMANSKSNLYYHISTRHKEETFLCDQCEYSTNRRGNLQQHIKVKHSKFRFKCDLCDAKYTSVTALKRHDLKHNPAEAKFRCEEPNCDYTTHHIDNFKRHEEKVHQGIRWPCELCNYVGGYKGDLSKHVKIVHQGFILKCTMCDYTTPKKYYLKGHMLKVHGLETEIPDQP